MRAEGVIVAVNDSIATVNILQQSACAGCSASCASCHKMVMHSIETENLINAVVGERVWVESSAGRILLICFLVFVFPPILVGISCALLWKCVSGLALACLSVGIAAVSFMCLYMTVGKKLIAGNSYKITKKY